MTVIPKLSSDAMWQLGAFVVAIILTVLAPRLTSETIEYRPRDQQNDQVSSEEYRAFLDQIRKYCSVRGRKLELARKLKVSPQLVTYWLRGDRQLSLEQFFAIKAIMEGRK